MRIKFFRKHSSCTNSKTKWQIYPIVFKIKNFSSPRVPYPDRIYKWKIGQNSHPLAPLHLLELLLGPIKIYKIKTLLPSSLCQYGWNVSSILPAQPLKARTGAKNNIIILLASWPIIKARRDRKEVLRDSSSSLATGHLCEGCQKAKGYQ